MNTWMNDGGNNVCEWEQCGSENKESFNMWHKPLFVIEQLTCGLFIAILKQGAWHEPEIWVMCGQGRCILSVKYLRKYIYSNWLLFMYLCFKTSHGALQMYTLLKCENTEKSEVTDSENFSYPLVWPHIFDCLGNNNSIWLNVALLRWPILIDIIWVQDVFYVFLAFLLFLADGSVDMKFVTQTVWDDRLCS